jgi:multimeric flavodoxin WrbA
MKVVVINGDPNKRGPAIKMLEAYLEGVKEDVRHIDVEWYDIMKMRILPCEECGICKSGRISGCIIKDDMTPVYDKVHDADLLLIGFPIVRWHLPGKLKVLVDRLYALDLPRVRGDQKKLSYLCTYRYEDEKMTGVQEVNQYFHVVSRAMNFELLHASHHYHIEAEGRPNKEIINTITKLW